MDMGKLGAALAPIVRAEIARATEALQQQCAALEATVKELQDRKPETGKDGTSVDPADVAKMVAEAVSALPAPKDGASPAAEDVAACFERRFSEFLLSGERRIYEMADKAIDRMPRAKDGTDGIGWDAMSVEFDGERTVTLVFDKGTEQFTYPLTFPVVLDKGFWKEGTEAGKGDGYTFGGSYWIAQKATDSKPETGNPDWRLAVKKGRDGKRE